ncbi:hypothetical protein ITJ38_05610 [Agreia pratensis]|uniref:hypothetical protein n=1 Tax=Microbacteriaceae TaxID=85023 RepID=UPI00188C5471|nr:MULTISPECIES: hypothetical protein [Microbacteriaceae]MBF4561238.1 hypothetical protein [Microbacterium sp. VKM Ac-2870]MBF4633873.1 hypothetical protein [Agreia pratensis]
MDPTDRRRRAALIAAIAGGLVLLILVGVGIFGLLRGPDTSAPSPSTTTTTPTPAITGGIGPRPIVALDEPKESAAAVADATFTWDTTSGYSPSDYAQELADVTASIEADAAATDVRAYLPTPAAWAQLRTHQTRQWLTIDTISIPDAWGTAVAQAAPGQIPDGAVAYTITGTRHRDGIWNTEPVTTAHPVAFTVFLTCAAERSAVPPPGTGITETCQLLRLSQLDNPLR